jgi:hypothetical protein
MKTFKDQVIESISSEIRAELMEELLHGDALREFMTVFREKIREEIQNEIDEEEAVKVRSEIADQIYEEEADEIKCEVVEQIAEERENLRDYVSNLVAETKNTLEGEFTEKLISAIKGPAESELDKIRSRIVLDMEVATIAYLDSQLAKFKVELDYIIKEGIARLVLDAHIADK